jgi:anaerobic selenocysteine-containing dehydrogenase
MTEWKKTSCVLCAQNCGLEVQAEGSRIVKVRPDRDNPRSEGYSCRKGLKIAHFQSHAQRLKHPLKKVGSGFERITWDQAIAEITAKLKAILDRHGPRALAYMGGGGQGCHFEAAFGRALLHGLGSRYHYNAMAQELTGMFWVHGRTFGRQYVMMLPDEHESDMLVAVGWNGWMSHQMAQARRRLKEFSEDPDKLLVVIDPRKTETAQRADIHLPIRPGTDALFTRAACAMIIDRGWRQQEYLQSHCAGLEEVLPLFTGFDYQKAIAVCGLDLGQVSEVVKLMTTRKCSFHADLGTLMGRHSTATSWLQVILLALCGRLGVRGGNIFPGTIMPVGGHSDERKPDTWRAAATGFPEIMGYFPPNVLPEEILSDREDRVRAVMISGSNPLRSYADTTAYEKAMARAELTFTIDVAMSETAALSHYVLPALTAYEKSDASFFAWNFPEIYFMMRRPVCAHEGEGLEESEIMTRLAEGLGLLPAIPDDLKEAARGDRGAFMMKLMGWVGKNPAAMKFMPMVMARTLGPALGSNNLAALWGLLQTAPPAFREDAARAGFAAGPRQGEELFSAILAHPEGLWVGKSDASDNFKQLKTKSGKIELFIPELADWVQAITPEAEDKALASDSEYPLLLVAGRHMDYNANTMMRDPAWNRGHRACTVLMHPSDADAIGVEDGQMARVETEAGAEVAEVEVSEQARPGQVIIPHGFGLVYEGDAYGANVNRLTPAKNRDPIAATPLHRYVRCRVRPAGNGR